MSLFKKLFGKSEETETKQDKGPKGFSLLAVRDVIHLTDDAVQVTFEIPADKKNDFQFIPGQYVNLSATIEGNEVRRSYSICSAPNEGLAVGIKKIDGGLFSSFAKNELKTGDSLYVSAPQGNFQYQGKEKTIVAFAAGSGITPIFSIAKSLPSDAKMHLFYGNRFEQTAMFLSQISSLNQVQLHAYLSGEQKEGFSEGRLDKNAISAAIKADLNLLKADVYYLCGPEEMIVAAVDVLKMFGVSKEKIKFELFTTPVHLISEPVVESGDSFSGTSKVTVILDDEKMSFSLKTDGKTILDAVNNEGYDAPYSCRGGVCCTCRAKVLKGSAKMTLNYSLTDEEVRNGYILTCQAHPTSEEIVISYDA